MLEKIARENNVERSVFQRPSSRTVLMDERYLRNHMFGRFRIEIHPVLFASLNRIDEFAPPTTKIEDRAVLWNKALKKRVAKLYPDSRPILLQSRESKFVLQG